MRVKEIILNEERNVSLKAFIQDVGGEFQFEKRPAVLILPGGGYGYCSNREAETVAFAYSKAGFQTFVLRYSVGEHKKWPNPLVDYEQAMELIRGTESWHIYPDKIAVIGFSAGGHLAACAGTLGKNRPNALILGYAVLSQDSADMCQLGMPAPLEHVDEYTPPCFLFSGRDDRIVSVQDTVDFQRALLDYQISFETHIYAYAAHGFSTAEKSLTPRALCSRTKNWVDDSIAWLEDIFGEFQPGGLGTPACRDKIAGDYEEYLSLDCTLGHLMKQDGAARELLKPIFSEVEKVLAEMKEENADFDRDKAYKRALLRDVVKLVGISDTQVQSLEDALKKIKNQKK